MKKIIAFIFIVLLCLSCGKKEETIKIGAILPLTGDAAILGNETKEGMELALEEINKNKKVMNISFEDSRNNANDAVNILNSLINIDKTKIFVSAMSGVTSAIIPIVDKNNALLFTTVTAKPNITKEGSNIFRFYYTTDIQGETVVKYITNTKKLKKVGVLFLNDDYGISGLKYIEEFQKKYGYNIIVKEAIQIKDESYRNQIAKIKSSKPEALIVIAYGNELIKAIKQIREAKILADIFTYTGIANPEILNNLRNLTNGIYLSIGEFNPFQPNNKSQSIFFEKIKNKYGKQPSHYHAFGYDLLNIIYRVSSKEINVESMKTNLLKIENFQGILGPITINSEREISLKQKIVKIENMQFIEVVNGN